MGFYYLYLTSKDYYQNENEDKKDEELQKQNKNGKLKERDSSMLDYNLETRD